MRRDQVIVEVTAGPGSDIWGHPELLGEHPDRVPEPLEPVEDGPVVAYPSAVLRAGVPRELLRVPEAEQPNDPTPQDDEGLCLLGQTRLVQEYRLEL